MQSLQSMEGGPGGYVSNCAMVDTPKNETKFTNLLPIQIPLVSLDPDNGELDYLGKMSTRW